MIRSIYLMIVCLFVFCQLFAQQSVSMDEAVAVALSNHPAARNAVLAEQSDALMKQQAVGLSPIQVKYWQRSNGAGNDRLWSVTQDFGSIPEHFQRTRDRKSTRLNSSH